jgi:cation transport protein ChaC
MLVESMDMNNTSSLLINFQHLSPPDEKVWGAAYHIPPERVDEVRTYLDIREINGYSIQYTPFHPVDGTISTQRSGVGSTQSIKCLVYIGLPNNPQFLGPQDPDVLAAHILQSRGPSGENREYLYLLGEALHLLGTNSRDEHVRDLIERCKLLEAERKMGDSIKERCTSRLESRW